MKTGTRRFANGIHIFVPQRHQFLNVTGGLITPDFFVLSRLLGYDFLSAAAVLEGLLERHESRLPKTAPRREAK